ncbi:AMP-binding protein [Pusillimonas sp. TS35]|nr:AMP-binding protein [Pusillimonas sp. TS35]
MDVIGNRTLRDLLQVQAACYGDKIFLVHETAQEEITEFSYREICRKAFEIATYLESKGLKKGDKVFVFLRNTPNFIATWFGIVSAGLVMVPGNIYLTESEIEYQIQHSDPSLIVTEDNYLEVIKKSINSKKIEITLENDIVAESEGITQDSPLPSITSDDLAQVLYTSGTSARPKGVMLTHANFIWSAISSALHSNFTPNDRIFNNKPLFHANCQDSVVSGLFSGATVIIGERYSASRYMTQLVRHKATVCSLSGMLCRTLLNQPASALDTSHSIRFAGYAINISEDEIQRFQERFNIKLRNSYGQSESMLYVTFESLTGPSTYPSIGRPAIGRDVFIVDENALPLSANQTGEIVVSGIRGRTLMLGYLNDETATKETLKNGWLHTGDLGYFDEAGNLFFFGRKKEIIKRSGENISAAEVEEALMMHPSVRDVAVIGIPDPVRDQAVMACIVTRNDTSITQADITEHCQKYLAYFKVPTYIKFFDELPRNASGKVLKRELIERSKNG